MPEDRRHAAIMFTDIVGYTRLMGSDEKKAVDMLSRNRSIHQSCIEKFYGTLIKEIGDGILASFSLASEAVHCAIEIQKECKDQSIPLKIGIHEGEMIFSESDVIGDGVNIASRLQEDAQEGCINISASVYGDIKNKADIKTMLVGEKSFKNVDEIVRIYKIVCTEEESKAQLISNELVKKPRSKLPYYILIGTMVVIIAVLLIWKFLPLKEKIEIEKSIAVLPFDYLGEDQSKQYLADGVMDAITGHLSKIDGLRVTPKTSVEQYRKTTKTASVIGDELDVSYLIEGSFLMINNQVRLTILLVNADEEDHDLYREYDKDWSEIFDVQSEVAQTIANEVEVIITPEVKESIESDPTENVEAYNLYLQGRHFWIQEGKENLDKSIEYYKRALDLDTNYAFAYAAMAVTYNSYGWYMYLPNREVLPYAKSAAVKALELDNNLGEAYAELAFTRLLLDWDWKASEKEFKKAIELNPNDARTHNLYAWLLSDIGRHDEALEESKRAHELDPLSVLIWVNLGRRYYFARDYDRAILEYRKILDLFPDNNFSSVSWYARSQLALALFQKGLYDAALAEYSKTDYEATWPCYLGYIYGIIGKREKALEILNQYLELSKKEFVWNASIAIIYIGLGEKDKAFEWLEKSYEQREGWMTQLKVDPIFDSLRSDPRFQNLMERINFPD